MLARQAIVICIPPSLIVIYVVFSTRSVELYYKYQGHKNMVLSQFCSKPYKSYHRCRGGFRHGRPGQPPSAALFHKTWGAARALKKKIIWAAKRFSIIYHITVCGIGKLAPPAAA